MKVRFDTWFFLAARRPRRARARRRGDRRLGLVRAAGALQAQRDGELLLVFPTIKQLEELAQFDYRDALLESHAGRVRPILPKVVVRRERPACLLPGEPGYDG